MPYFTRGFVVFVYNKSFKDVEKTRSVLKVFVDKTFNTKLFVKLYKNFLILPKNVILINLLVFNIFSEVY